MTTRQGPGSRGADRGREIVRQLAREAETARRERGTSYATLGRGMGISGAQAARLCRGQSPQVSIMRAAQLLAILGLDLTARAYPSGPTVRDVAQLRLLARLRPRVAGALAWRTEVPVVELPQAAAIDRRSWDAVIDGPGWALAVEAETRCGDVQAMQRRIASKQRDGAVTAVVLLLAETRHHRVMLELAGDGLNAQFPVSARRALRLLSTGQPPAGNAIVVL